MAHVDSQVEAHAPGSFCWFELATTDQAAAKRFYAGMFGYEIADFPMGSAGVYTMFQFGGRNAAAGCSLNEEQLKKGVPPHWALYVCVESADLAVKRVADAGGIVLGGPFDVADAGRTAVLRDPTGAVFHVWEPRRNRGTGVEGVEGTVCWADLHTPDPARASKFYAEVFGWHIAPGENDASGYLHIRNGDEFIGGVPGPMQAPAGLPPHWMVYFQVDDCEASVEKAQRLGGKILAGVMTLENAGRFAAIDDPQGAGFALFEPVRKS